jgi:hypothetical protein
MGGDRLLQELKQLVPQVGEGALISYARVSQSRQSADFGFDRMRFREIELLHWTPTSNVAIQARGYIRNDVYVQHANSEEFLQDRPVFHEADRIEYDSARPRLRVGHGLLV